MNSDFVTKNKEYFYLAFFIVALITFYPLFFTGFATADDFHFYLMTRRGLVKEDAFHFATVAGRFYFYIVKPLYNLPYVFDNMVVVKIFHLVPLIFCFLLFARIIRMMTGSRELSWLFLLVFLMTMQISQHTSLFLAYPFFFTFSFSLLLISFILLLRYYENKKRSMLVLAALFFLVGLLFYETYIFFLLFAGLTIAYHNLREKRPWQQAARDSFLELLPFLAIGILYIATYFIFRIYHPSQYAGTSFGMKEVTLKTFFAVLWHLSFSAFPLTIYSTEHTLFWDKSELVSGYSPVLLRLILSAHVEWIVKGVVVAFCGYKLLLASPRLKTAGLLGAILIALMMIFLPHLPLALTEKYTFHAGKHGMLGYVTTFYSFFGVLLLITVLLSYLMNLFNFNLIAKRIITSLFVLGFFICSVLTDFSNYTVAKDIRSANLRFYAIDELLKTDEFRAIPAGTPFYAKELWDNPSSCARGVTEQDFNWYEYFEAKNKVTYPVGRDSGYFLTYSKTVPQVPWYLTLRQAEKSEDVTLVMAKMLPLQPRDSVVDHFADRATVIYYSSYKIFTVSFRVRASQPGDTIPIRVNQINDKEVPMRTVEMNVYDTKKGHPATIFTIQFPGIDLNSIMISNMTNKTNKYFYL